MRHYIIGMLLLLLNASFVWAECKIIETSEKTEVVCEENKPVDIKQSRVLEPERSDKFKYKVCPAPERPEYTISVGAVFDHNIIVSANETIFDFNISDYYDRYQYIGRTGDKTFEINRISYWPGNKEKTETLKLFFEENGVVPLNVVPLYASCVKDEVKLKMVKLNSNQLELRVVLPECLRKELRDYEAPPISTDNSRAEARTRRLQELKRRLSY